jgi:ATP-dependent Lon protease
MPGVYKIEMQMTSGNGKFERTGLGSDSKAKESVDSAYSYLKANARNISHSISLTTKDYLLHLQDLNGAGMTSHLTLPSLIAICSVALEKPVLSGSVILGDLSIGGTLIKVEELANTLQVCLDSGAKKILLPITSAGDLGTAPAELVGRFNLIFYQSAEDAVFKALGVE